MNPLVLALQGIGFGALLTAVQGVSEVVMSAPEPLRYYTVGGMTPEHRRRLMEEDEALMAILQMFVMEEA